jgi:hypothetical protein
MENEVLILRAIGMMSLFVPTLALSRVSCTHIMPTKSFMKFFFGE